MEEKKNSLSIFIEVVEYFMQKREGHSLKKVVSLVLGKKGRRAILWIFQNIRFCFGYPFQQIPFRAVNCEKIENLHSCRHQFQLVNFLLGDDFCKKFIPYEEKSSSQRLHTHKLLTYDWHQLGRKLKEAPQWPRFQLDKWTGIRGRRGPTLSELHFCQCLYRPLLQTSLLYLYQISKLSRFE